MSSPPAASGPTHDDITADCVAKAFGAPLEFNPTAVAIITERAKAMGTEMNEARMRMARIPRGAALIPNKVSGAPGFWIGNVIVMAGVPSIMQAMLDAVAPTPQDRREDAFGDHPRRRAGRRRRHRARRVAKANPDVIDRQLSVLRREARAQHQYRRARARRRKSLAAAKAAVEAMLARVKDANGARRARWQ